MEALSLSDDIFDAAPAAPPPAWLAAASSSAPPASSSPPPASSAAAVPTECTILLDLPDDVLSDHVLTQLRAADLARVEAASARLRDLVARAVPIAVRGACEILLPQQRRTGERWPAVLRRAELLAASRDVGTRVSAGYEHAVYVRPDGSAGLIGKPQMHQVLPDQWPTGVRAVACGGEHTAVLLASGVLSELLGPRKVHLLEVILLLPS